LSLVKQEQQVQLTLLTSITVIGIKTALFMIVITDGFDKFKNAKQLCNYEGITATISDSGSSVRGRGSISKVVIESCETFCFCVLFQLANIIKSVAKFMSGS
jgi:transposase